MQPDRRHLQTVLAPAWGNSRRDCFYRVQAQGGEAGRSRVEKAGNQLAPPEIYGNDLPMRYECRLPAWLFKELFYVRNVDFMGINTEG